MTEENDQVPQPGVCTDTINHNKKNNKKNTLIEHTCECVSWATVWRLNEKGGGVARSARLWADSSNRAKTAAAAAAA